MFFEAIVDRKTSTELRETCSYNNATAANQQVRDLMVEMGDVLCGSKRTEAKAAQRKR